MQNRHVVKSIVEALKAVCYIPHANFSKSLHAPKAAQTKVLKRYLRALARTEYGIAHGIKGTETYEQFAQKIPIRSYEEMDRWIQKQLARPTERIISKEKMVHIETTSGSTSAHKQIPFTKSLISSFSKLFAIWAYDLLSNGLALETAKIFISVSPKPTKSSDGFDGDEQYLKEPLKTMVSKFLVSSPKTNDWSKFQTDLSLKLLRTPDLEIISIWSPTYLLSLMQYIESHRRELETNLGCDIPVLQNSRVVDWTRVFPKLQLISCWTSANAKQPAAKLQQKFPGVKLQGKGLLSTEAPITVPITKADGCLPLVNDVFLEFEDQSGMLHTVDDLQIHDHYQVIVTQASGLTRYRTEDIVQVTGFYKKTPVLDFVGRANSTSDLVGEKLTERFVRATLALVLRDKSFILVPRQRETAAYLLLLDATDDAGLRALECFEQSNCDFRPFEQVIAELCDEALCSSHHYNLARNQHQLAQVQTLLISDLPDVYQSFQLREGIKLGDIKDSSMIAEIAKANRFIQFVSGSLGKSRMQPLETAVQSTAPAQEFAPQIPFPVATSVSS